MTIRGRAVPRQPSKPSSAQVAKRPLLSARRRCARPVKLIGRVARCLPVRHQAGQQPAQRLGLRRQRAGEAHAGVVDQQRREGLDVDIADQLGLVLDVDPARRWQQAAGDELAAPPRRSVAPVGVAGAAPGGAQAGQAQWRVRRGCGQGHRGLRS
jgi:hypothetical protein